MMLSSFILYLPALFAVCTSANSFPGDETAIDTRSLKEIYQAAQNETGTLQIAWGGDEPNQELPVVEAFAQAFPAIKFNLTVDLSKYHDSRINRAYEQDMKYADVTILQTLQDFNIWKANGRLLPYKPPTFDSLFTEVRDPEGAFLPAVIVSLGPFISNPNKTIGTKIPKSYADVLAPEWKSKLVLTYPNDDDAITFLFSQIIQKYGWQWLDALVQQDVQWVRGTQTPATIISGNSTRSLTFTSLSLPGLNSSVPISDFYMSWAATMAILATTDMPETAKLFVAFIHSDDFQKAITQEFPFATHKDIGTPIWNVNNTDVSSFHQFMLQRDLVESWRFQFETVLGPAQGLSPLTDDI